MPRRSWEPTDRERTQIEAMASYGIPRDRIAELIGVDEKTLLKHCRRELDIGATKVQAEVGGLLVGSILGRQSTEKDAPPIITDGRARAALLMFYCKTRMGWRETSNHQLIDKDGKPVSLPPIVILPDNGRDSPDGD